VTEFNYRYHDAARAHIFVGVELSEGQPEREALVARLVAAGYGVVDLTDNETAKLHIRYMVGGHAQGLRDETLWRVRVPRAPRRAARLPATRWAAAGTSASFTTATTAPTTAAC
jgi:threonine dehydratase